MILHRLRVASGVLLPRSCRPFTPDAIFELHKVHTKGTPRLTSQIADNTALMMAFAQKSAEDQTGSRCTRSVRLHGTGGGMNLADAIRRAGHVPSRVEEKATSADAFHSVVEVEATVPVEDKEILEGLNPSPRARARV